MIDAIVDDINQKRIGEGVPQAELPSRPHSPKYTKPQKTSSTSLSKTTVTKRNLPSIAKVTFADTVTAYWLACCSGKRVAIR